ncbi:MMPL family transporter [Streptomyces sp. NPDC006875]|uniref:MMPL family transporter n=1 Tax=Streptomyces sp. NPDC006875 TaxID=3154781 RepID=UPI0033FDF554
MIVVWLLVLVAAFAADRAWGGGYEDEFSLPGTSAQRGADLLEEHGSDLKGVGAQIVLRADDGLAAHRTALDAATARLGRLPGVLTVSGPLSTPGAVSADGGTGYATVRFAANPATFDRSYLAGVDRAVAGLRAERVSVDYGGPLGQLARPAAADGRSEAIGLVTAVVVLLFGFGSVAAAGLPLVTAVAGLAGGVAVTARVITCAAIVMTSVFLAFLLSTNVVIKMMALGLGVSVVIDATLVRLLLVPATMYLFGRANWWLPRPLDRILPRLDPEGPDLTRRPESMAVRGPETVS